MKTSLMKSTFVTALSATNILYVAGQDVTACVVGFQQLQFGIFDFDNYNTFFDEESYIVLAQTGVYTGPDSMEEYVKFASPFSPYFDDVETGPFLDAFPVYDEEEESCIFTRTQIRQYTFSDELVPKSKPVKLAVATKIFFSLSKNKIEKIHVYYAEGWLGYFFVEKLRTNNVYDFICGTMRNECGFEDVDISGDCQKQLRELPVTDGTYVDRDSQGCRVLHASFAVSNPDTHCPHIAFTPYEDPNGLIKCTTSSGINPTDLFDTDDFGMYETFCEDNGIDPAQGYSVLGKGKAGKTKKAP